MRRTGRMEALGQLVGNQNDQRPRDLVSQRLDQGSAVMAIRNGAEWAMAEV
jgi:hypothetical protein